MKHAILVVDDEPSIRLTFRIALETAGHAVREAATADGAIEAFQREGPFDLLLLDLRIGPDSGLDVLTRLTEHGIHAPAVMITAYGKIADAVAAMKLGAIDFLEKPIHPEALRAMVGDVLARHEPAPARPQAPDRFESHLKAAKRAINLRDFAPAATYLEAALRLNDESPEAHNLQGVLCEMHQDYDAARRAYGRAIRLDPEYPPAQQNMRRLFELFRFGSSHEAFHLGQSL